GLSYAKNVFISTLQYHMHKMGMLCSLKYRDLAGTNYQDKTEVYYSSHDAALDVVRREKPKKVLDIGCGPGYVAHQCEQLGAETTGLDAYEPLPGRMTRFCRVDLETNELPVDLTEFDMVLFLDVIEHLKEPERFLLELRNRSAAVEVGDMLPLFVITTPNIAFFVMRLNLLMGRFNYAERGILDITHKRLFTRQSLKRALVECGYPVKSIRGVGAPFQTVMAGWSGKILGAISSSLATMWPSMFAFQFLVECRPMPGTRQILHQIEPVVVAEPLQNLTNVESK
ncbi:MAG: class I SAM-dependent methyltransferase, partial [Planctomycetales bacterium]